MSAKVNTQKWRIFLHKKETGFVLKNGVKDDEAEEQTNEKGLVSATVGSNVIRSPPLPRPKAIVDEALQTDRLLQQ